MAETTPGGLRIGNAERDDTIALLREHTTAGRLDLDEFEDRVGQVTAARTNADLQVVLIDLPPIGRQSAQAKPTPPRPPHPHAAASPGVQRHHHGRARRPLPGWVKLSLLMIAIWAMAGFGYFWPVWIIVPCALGSLGSCGRSRSRHPESSSISA